MTVLYQRALQTLVAAAILVAVSTGYSMPARAAATTVQIIEPSVIPQSWGYGPSAVTVTLGETVTWTNTGNAPHSVTADSGAFDSGIMLSSVTWSFTASTPGSYGYYCSLHPDMRGTLMVVES